MLTSLVKQIFTFTVFLTNIKFLFITVSSFFISTAFAQTALNIYTSREPTLIQPLITSFEQENKVKVNILFLNNGLIERLKNEGERSPADVLLLADGASLEILGQEGLTQPINKEIIDKVVPAYLRDEQYLWTALSLRARVLYVAKDLKDPPSDYNDLANPKWRGKICIRAGQHPYNLGLIAAMIAHQGEQQTRTWLKAVKENLARKASGGDRDVARDIVGGICDVGIANSYYVGIMKNSAENSDNYRWAQGIRVILPNFQQHGTHVNISGAAIAKHAPNRLLAEKLIKYLLSESAQATYAHRNYEYPVRTGVKADELTESFGTLKADQLPLAKWFPLQKRASILVDEVGFDR